MNTLFKPYRLINADEVQTLQRRFNTAIVHWNETYSTKCIQVQLTPTTANPIKEDEELFLLHHHNQSIALLENHYVSFITSALFDEQSISFNDAGHAVFMILIDDLFSLESVQKISNTTCINDWFYPGSPGLTLTLTHNQHRLNLYLDPDWIINQLPKPQKSMQALSPLKQALSAQVIHLDVQFESLYLSISQLLTLQIGDLIQTDHVLSAPLHLNHQQHSLFQVNAGQVQENKSIQLLRTS